MNLTKEKKTEILAVLIWCKEIINSYCEITSVDEESQEHYRQLRSLIEDFSMEEA